MMRPWPGKRWNRGCPWAKRPALARGRGPVSGASEIVGEGQRNGRAVTLGELDRRAGRRPGPAGLPATEEARADCFAVDGDQLVSLLEAGAIGGAAGRHMKDVEMVAFKHGEKPAAVP